eukprot:5173608-Amphidinium_carterae.1
MYVQLSLGYYCNATFAGRRRQRLSVVFLCMSSACQLDIVLHLALLLAYLRVDSNLLAVTVVEGAQVAHRANR